MTDRARILVVAATARELAVPDGWRTLECGVGPVDAAVRTAAAIAAAANNGELPDAVLHVGIAGARRARAIAPASLVIGDRACYCDLGVSTTWAPNTVHASRELLAAVQQALPSAPTMTIGTSARIGGALSPAATYDAPIDVEAMEGFAVLRAAALANIPAIEVRAISNDIEATDRAQWHFEAAFGAIVEATPRLVHALITALRTTS